MSAQGCISCTWHTTSCLQALLFGWLYMASLSLVSFSLGRRLPEAGEGRIITSPHQMAVAISCMRNFCFPLQISLNSSQILGLCSTSSQQQAHQASGWGCLLSEQNRHLLSVAQMLTCGKFVRLMGLQGDPPGYSPHPLNPCSINQMTHFLPEP